MTITEAIETARQNGKIAAEQGATMVDVDRLWEMELANGDWADVLSVLSTEEAFDGYLDGLIAGQKSGFAALDSESHDPSPSEMADWAKRCEK